MPLKTHLDEQPTLNLTPMIDIVFLLIIFFMVGTKFTDLERQINVSVPRVGSAGALTSAPERRVITIEADGAVALDDVSCTVAELSLQLAAAQRQYPQLRVVIRGDSQVAYQRVASVFSACREAGIEDIGISVRLAGGGAPHE